MKITSNQYSKFQNLMVQASDKAKEEMLSWIRSKGGYKNVEFDDAIKTAYALATKYGEATASLSALMYDSIAEKSGASVPPAEVAPTVSLDEVKKTIYGASSFSQDDEYIAGTVGRMTKQAGADTTLKNAKRDGAEFAWVTSGDSCAYCELLSNFGWQHASAKTIKGDHAEHIHANCQCQFVIRFDHDTTVEGYNPNPDFYNSVSGKTIEEKASNLRRENESAKQIKYTEAYNFAQTPQTIIDYEKKARNLKKETGIITDANGNVFDESKGKTRSVQLNATPEAGYFMSHNHPIDTNFSVSDVNNFEKNGHKQVRACSPNYTYVIEASNPKQLKDADDRLFTDAMENHWKELDEESATKRKEINAKAMEIEDRSERTKYLQQEYQNLLDWRNQSEDSWLKENAPKYGYHYKRENVN